FRVQPMLATLVPEPFNAKGWVFEEKCDGYRILCVQGGQPGDPPLPERPGLHEDLCRGRGRRRPPRTADGTPRRGSGRVRPKATRLELPAPAERLAARGLRGLRLLLCRR